LAEDKESFSDRKENLDELIAKAIEWEMSSPDPSLEAFLEELSLKSSLDETDASQDRLSLMTIHNGKGLEFDVTFLVGLEEDLFPHANSRNSPEAVEEERRLCYVGITRAKQFLYLSYCRSRYLWGTLRLQRMSRFLKEIPQEYIEKFKSNYLNSSYKIKDIPLKPYALEAADVNLTINIQKNEYVEGDWVYHKEFGRGEIKQTYTGSMGLTYKILFENEQSLKTIVAKYAVLKPQAF